jgi:hypothetical protein
MVHRATTYDPADGERLMWRVTTPPRDSDLYELFLGPKNYSLL